MDIAPELKYFLHKNYDVLWSHPESTGRWSTFLLGEIHRDIPIERMNALFLSLFSKPGSILMMEEDSSGKFEGDLKDKLLSISKIHTSGDTITVIGWDNKCEKLIRTMEFVNYACILLNNLLSETVEDSTLLDRLEVIHAYQNGNARFEKLLIDKFQECLEPSRIAAFFHVKRFIKRGLMARKDRADSTNLILHYKGWLQSYLVRILQESFDQRTESMVHTLQKVHKAQEGECSVLPNFLIAGISHLITDYNFGEGRMKYRFSLKYLYDYLNLYGQETVVLIPKLFQIAPVPAIMHLEHSASQKIQSTFRFYSLKKREIIEEQSRLNSAAVLIQKIARGHLSRKQN